ncbi:MAG: hypothetical protein Q9226_004692 [Calogaya cf. arnoldii]
MEQLQDDTKQMWKGRHIEQEKVAERKDQMLSTEDREFMVPPDPTRRMSKVPLPDQGLAFRAALQGSAGPSTDIRRGGDYGGRAHIDKENYSGVTEVGFKAASLSCAERRKSKMPLAEQGTAFQAALRRSDGVLPNLGEGASRHRKQIDDIRIKGAAAATLQHGAATQRRQQKKTADTRQQGRQH